MNHENPKKKMVRDTGFEPRRSPVFPGKKRRVACQVANKRVQLNTCITLTKWRKLFSQPDLHRHRIRLSPLPLDRNHDRRMKAECADGVRVEVDHRSVPDVLAPRHPVLEDAHDGSPVRVNHHWSVLGRCLAIPPRFAGP